MQSLTASNSVILPPPFLSSLGPVPCSLDVFLHPEPRASVFPRTSASPCTPYPTPTLAVFQAWPDRREPPALRAAARLSNNGGDDYDYEQSQSCDVRLLFVSGTGLAHAARGQLGDEGDGGASTAAARGGAATASDMWGVLGRELWRPWPQADVVVHTGSQVKSSYCSGGRSFLCEGTRTSDCGGGGAMGGSRTPGGGSRLFRSKWRNGSVRLGEERSEFYVLSPPLLCQMGTQNPKQHQERLL